MVVGQLPFDSPYFDQHRGKRLAGIISADPVNRLRVSAVGQLCGNSNRWPILQSRTAKDEQSASRLEATSSMVSWPSRNCQVFFNYQSNLFGQFFSANHDAEEAGLSEIRAMVAMLRRIAYGNNIPLQIKIPARRFLHRLLGLRDRLRRRKKSSKIFSPSEHPGPGTDGGCRQQTVAVAELRRQLLAAVDQEAAAVPRRRPPASGKSAAAARSADGLGGEARGVRSVQPGGAEGGRRSCWKVRRDRRQVVSLATTAQVHQGSVTAATASGRPARPNGLLI
uniref:Protein kinase domain-containing protein n=1 Tax=Macrostomum lignano TaxID=282301 RepID=A0A1I8JQI5_9PLAT